MELGQRIRKLREKVNWKQQDLANCLQVSMQAVSKWERGENFPDVLMVAKLANALGVSTDYLLGVREETSGVMEATVFSSSLNQFAAKSKDMDSKMVADWANVLFHHLTEAVLKFDGVPIKYVGDGFLCFFSGTYHADRALQAALHAKLILQNDALIITLNSGDIYLGTIGHPDYQTKDIYGEVVNLAFLIMDWVSKNCASGIGFTESVVQQLQKKYTFIEHPKTLISRIHSKIPIYELKEIYTKEVSKVTC